MKIRDYLTLHLVKEHERLFKIKNDRNSSKGITLVLLFCISQSQWGCMQQLLIVKFARSGR